MRVLENRSTTSRRRLAGCQPGTELAIRSWQAWRLSIDSNTRASFVLVRNLNCTAVQASILLVAAGCTRAPSADRRAMLLILVTSTTLPSFHIPIQPLIYRQATRARNQYLHKIKQII